MNELGLTPEELLTTTRTVRRRLDLIRPVDRTVVEECLRLAFQAPTGSNQQQWGWVLVDDPATRAAMADIYSRGMDHAVTGMEEARAAGVPMNVVTERSAQISSSVAYLRDHLHEVPVMLVPTIAGRVDHGSTWLQASLWGSVLPAVWSLMLALRLRGLGSAWTTLHLHYEREMADLLGIPFHAVTQAGLFPIAYTLGKDFKAVDRSASEQTIRWNHW
jgi:nitroreductase